MKSSSDLNLRKLRHDFKMGIENLLAAITMHGEDDGNEIEGEDSEEVFRVLKDMEQIWINMKSKKNGLNK